MTGEELKKRRTKMGVTQEQLARQLDVSLYTVARWEQLKDRTIPNSRILDLALDQLAGTKK